MIARYALIALALWSASASADMASQGERGTVAGLDVVTYRTHVKDVVVITGALPAGDAMAGTGNPAIPTLTGMMLDRGTKSLDKFAIAKQLDDVGAQISFGVGPQSVQVQARCLAKDLPLVVGLIAAELREPAFSSAEFAKARQQFIGSLESALQSTESRAQESFGLAAYPQGHPNRPHSAEEYIAAAKTAKLEEVRNFHARFYGPAHMTLVLAGDVPADARAVVAKAFGGWTGGQDYLQPASPARPAGSRLVAVPLKDKASVTVIMGEPTGLKYRDPDGLALHVGTAILGRGFTSRLMGVVRDKEGLTYNISASIAQDTVTDGAFSVSASFAPSLLERGIASTQREIQAWWRDGVTERELADRKHGIVGGYFVGLSTTSGVATTILVNAQRGYGLDWLDGYPAAVDTLSRDAVNQAIHAHLDPAALVVVEAGSVPGAR